MDRASDRVKEASMIGVEHGVEFREPQERAA